MQGAGMWKCTCAERDRQRERERRRTIQYAAQANPYTIATDKASMGDVLRKYSRAAVSRLNQDNVPANWNAIPEGPQKWRLEELGKWLTVNGGMNIISWTESHYISLKDFNEEMED